MKYPSYNPSNNICHFCYCKRIYSVLFFLFGIGGDNIQQPVHNDCGREKETNKWIDIVFLYKSIEQNARFMSFCHFVQRHTHEMPSNHLILYLVFSVAWHGMAWRCYFHRLLNNAAVLLDSNRQAPASMLYRLLFFYFSCRHVLGSSNWQTYWNSRTFSNAIAIYILFSSSFFFSLKNIVCL